MIKTIQVNKHENETIRIIKLIWFMQYAGWGAFSVFFPVYLKQCGMSYTEIGIIAGVPLLIGIFAGMIWSITSDILKRRKPFIVQASLVMFLFTLAVTQLSSFTPILLLGVIRALFLPVVHGLLITSWFTISTDSKRATSFSSLAIWGAVGWAIATAVAGAAGSFFGPIAAIYLSSFIYLSATLISIALPEVASTKKTILKIKSSKTFLHRLWEYLSPLFNVMKNKKMAILLLASFPIAFAINAFKQFFSVYMGLLGGSLVMIGLAFAIPALLEVPVFLGVGKLSDKTGSRKSLLIMSGAVYSLIYFLVFLVQDPLVILILYSLLEPLAWPPLYVGSSTLISEIVPHENWVTAQTLYSIWSWSILGFIGPFVGGIISDMFGLPFTLVIISIMAAVSSLLFLKAKEK